MVAANRSEEGVRVNKKTFLSSVARRSGVPAEVVKKVYAAMVVELLSIVRGGGSLLLTGFGKFYPQPHHGHRVQFAKSSDGTPKVIDDYTVLKFSATRDVNRSLDEEFDSEGLDDEDA